MDKIENLTLDDTEDIIYNFTQAKVLKVYDGDTVTIGAWYDNGWKRFSVRIYGIDCAEIRGGTEETKKLAQEAKEYVKSLLLNKVIDIEVLNNKMVNNKKLVEKYGRLLARISINGNDIADSLCQANLARPYFGGTK
jgi:endonuclease YncB( thermonuclease family)